MWSHDDLNNLQNVFERASPKFTLNPHVAQAIIKPHSSCKATGVGLYIYIVTADALLPH